MTTPGKAEQDMRIADMWLSMDMKLQAEHYADETGTGGHDQFDPTAVGQ